MSDKLTKQGDFNSLPEEEEKRLRKLYEDVKADAQEGGKTDSTLAVYKREWEKFVEWCRDKGATPLPADPMAVIMYLEEKRREKNLAHPTLKKKAAAISHYHRKAGHDEPTKEREVIDFLENKKKKDANRQKKKAAPLLLGDLKDILSAFDKPPQESPDAHLDEECEHVKGIRDKALLLIGWICGLRRSELAQIRYSHLEKRDPDGYVLTLPRQKNDPDGQEYIKGIPRRQIVEGVRANPARALDKWLDLLRNRGYLEDKSRPIFRNLDRWGNLGGPITGRGISHALKKRFAAAGLDTGDYTPHSLRSGISTEASRRGAQVSDIMEVTGHSSMDGIQPYLRSGKIFDNQVFDAVLEESST